MKAKYFILFAIIAFIADHFLVSGGALVTFATASFAGQYDDTMNSYRALLDTKMRNVAWNSSYWTIFMGEIGGKKKSVFQSPNQFGSKGPNRPTGQPIEVMKDFMYQGRGNMDIPIFYPLTGKGLAGSLTATGKGERPLIATMQIFINQKRQVYLAQDSKMSKQLLQNPQMVKKLIRGGAEYLGDWFGRWIGFQPHYTFLEGFSENLVLPASSGGLAKGRQSHMNIYVEGSGRVTFSNTKATYEASVASALSGLTTTNVFSTQTIENAVYVARHNHRISPIKYDGMEVYPMLISDAAAKQLQADTSWNNRALYAAERSIKTNALFTGKIAGIYAGALIIIDSTLPSAYVTADGDPYFQDARSTTGASTGVCYGQGDSDSDPNFMANPVDSGARKPWILFGASAIACGIASDISLESEEQDFRQRKEVEADMIIGFQRSDILDTDGNFGIGGDSRYENVSSVVGFTYSPSNADWT